MKEKGRTERPLRAKGGRVWGDWPKSVQKKRRPALRVGKEKRLT